MPKPYLVLTEMTAKKYGSTLHEANDSSYQMEMSLLGLKVESEDQEIEDDDDDDEDDCSGSYEEEETVTQIRDTKSEDDMMKKRYGTRKLEGSVDSGNRKKRYGRTRSTRARSPTQVINEYAS